jgi:hypothetical protein
MRAILIAAVAFTVTLSVDASAQSRNRQFSPEQEAIREACRQEARRVHRISRRNTRATEADQARIREFRREYRRECMMRAGLR